MKAKLMFDLDDFDDRVRFKKASNADELYYAVTEFKSSLRSIRKYGREGWDDETVEKLHDLFHETMIDIDLDI